MKPITFENLRRLMGGGRKKKEKESSFKRSDSFKRISIRKSYLDRGKKKHLHKLEVATQTVTEEVDVVEQPVSTKDSSVQVDKIDITNHTDVQSKLSKKNGGCGGEGPGQSVIAYGQWLKGIRKDDSTTTTTAAATTAGGIKGCERTVIYIPASDEAKLPSPVIRQLSSSPIFRKKSPLMKRKQSPLLQRKESNDSAVEMFPWGDTVDIKKSPLIRRRSRQSPPLLPDSGAEEMCSLSISLGRIWMDAPQVMAPRSLELPRGSQNNVVAHNSLDSALKDLRDDHMVFNRLQRPAPPAVGRTLSSNSNNTTSTGLFSSKDSGFSFSISVPKLNDFNQSIEAPSKGFFRRKRPKPKLSVSRDGYFKRTTGANLIERTSIKRRSSRRKSSRNSRRKKKNATKNDVMYQVVINRPPRCLKSLKLDPMIFVPPEKRKSSINKKPSFKVNLREIRNFNDIYGDNVDDIIYESLPRIYDDMSDDQPLSGRISRISLREDDFEYHHHNSRSPPRDSLSRTVSSPYTLNQQSIINNSVKVNVYGISEINAGVINTEVNSSSFNHGNKINITNDICSIRNRNDTYDDDDTFSEDEINDDNDDDEEEEDNDHDDSSSSKCISPYVPPGVSPVPKRRPVKRRKSGLSHKKSITYVARPNIMRAPSTLRRTTSNCNKKTGENFTF